MSDPERRLDAGKFKRQALYADSEKNLFMREAKKDAMKRFTLIISKYNISEDDVDELLEISEFLL